MRQLKTILILLLFSLSLSSNSLAQNSQSFYIDGLNGSDSNFGTSPESPWKTLNTVNGDSLNPGTTVFFKRGSVFSDNLIINSSGTTTAPITFTAYGNGDNPIIENSSTKINVNINGSWIIFENFKIQNASRQGILLGVNANHNIIRSNEITKTGKGIETYGQHNLITKNYIHDLKIITSDYCPGDTTHAPGCGIESTSGNCSDNDSGAIAVQFNNSHNEASYNRIINAKDISCDYGTDGRAFEIWIEKRSDNLQIDQVSSNYIHHNTVVNTGGFLEAGGSKERSYDDKKVYDTKVAYNLAVNNSGSFTSLHTDNNSSSYGIKLNNFKVENNTIIETSNPSGGLSYAFGFSNQPITSNQFLLKNNLFFLKGFYSACKTSGKNWNFTHANNLYYVMNKNGQMVSNVGFTLTPSEIKVTSADTQIFEDLNNDNYHLSSSSPAIDQGTNLGYNLDLDNFLVPHGSIPDIGAYEYGSNQAPIPSSTNTPTLIPTNTNTPTPTSTLVPTNTNIPTPTSTSISPPTICQPPNKPVLRYKTSKFYPSLILLSWTNLNVNSYTLYYGHTTNNPQYFKPNISQTSTIIYDLTPKAKYCFSVSATNNFCGTGPRSAEICVNPNSTISATTPLSGFQSYILGTQTTNPSILIHLFSFTVSLIYLFFLIKSYKY